MSDTVVRDVRAGVSRKTRARQRGFFATTIFFTAILVGWCAAYFLMGVFFGGTSGGVGDLLRYVPGWTGLFLPFAVIGGGIATHRVLPIGSVAGRAAVAGVVSYVLVAFVVPLSKYRDAVAKGLDVNLYYPYGPETPGTLHALRSAVEANPPEEFGYSTNHPFQVSPNWWAYLFQSPIVFAVFAVLAALVGYRIGGLTSGLSPPRRRNARLGLGLLTAVAFFAAEAGGGEWVRSSPANSGLVGAWAAILVPVVELLILEVLIHGRTTGSASRA